jgi:hypothetical protein
VVAFFATDDRDVVIGYLQFFQDINGAVFEPDIVEIAAQQITVASSTPNQTASDNPTCGVVVHDWTCLPIRFLPSCSSPIDDVAQAVSAPAGPGAEWRAAVMSLFATSRLGATNEHIHQLQDDSFRQSERLRTLAVQVLSRLARDERDRAC